MPALHVWDDPGDRGEGAGAQPAGGPGRPGVSFPGLYRGRRRGAAAGAPLSRNLAPLCSNYYKPRGADPLPGASTGGNAPAASRDVQRTVSPEGG